MSASNDLPVVALTAWRPDRLVLIPPSEATHAIYYVDRPISWQIAGKASIPFGDAAGLESAKIAVLTALHKRHGRISVDGMEWIPPQKPAQSTTPSPEQ